MDIYSTELHLSKVEKFIDTLSFSSVHFMYQPSRNRIMKAAKTCLRLYNTMMQCLGYVDVVIDEDAINILAAQPKNAAQLLDVDATSISNPKPHVYKTLQEALKESKKAKRKRGRPRKEENIDAVVKSNTRKPRYKSAEFNDSQVALELPEYDEHSSQNLPVVPIYDEQTNSVKNATYRPVENDPFPKGTRSNILHQYEVAIRDAAKVNYDNIHLNTCKNLICTWFEYRIRLSNKDKWHPKFIYKLENIPSYIEAIVLGYSAAVRDNESDAYVSEFTTWCKHCLDEQASGYPLPYKTFLIAKDTEYHNSLINTTSKLLLQLLKTVIPNIFSNNHPVDLSQFYLNPFKNSTILNAAFRNNSPNEYSEYSRIIINKSQNTFTANVEFKDVPEDLFRLANLNTYYSQKRDEVFA